MAWTINYSDAAIKQLDKMNKSIARKIMAHMNARVSSLDNPRRQGEGLSHNKAGLWRYRIGDYRVICNIQDEKITILVVQIGHRREVYG